MQVEQTHDEPMQDALDAFIKSEAFDGFLLDCFAEGVREAIAEQRMLGKQLDLADPALERRGPDSERS